MITLFWILLFLVVYCYFGYPALIFILAKIKAVPIRKNNIEPAVSIIVAVHNEEDVIRQKIQNLLEIDYPGDKKEILIGSDASSDKTHEIIQQFNAANIKLHINSIRQGKMSILNMLVPKAQNQIIIFTDARQIFEKDAIRKLVSNFADPTVGSVSGELVFHQREGNTAKGISLYWRYEKFIRLQESHVHSMLGATGAIYAIRKELFVPGPITTVLDDMLTPFRIIKQGYRAIFDDTAHAYDHVADNPKEEFSRKTRTLYGNYQIFALCPEMFNPFQSPIALQLISHKLLRVVIPFFLIILFIINYQLRQEDVFSRLWILQIIFYTMALIGQLIRNTTVGPLKWLSKICYVPYIFCLLNYAALVGFFKFLTSQQQVTWQKARE